MRFSYRERFSQKGRSIVYKKAHVAASLSHAFDSNLTVKIKLGGTLWRKEAFLNRLYFVKTNEHEDIDIVLYNKIG